MKIIKWILGTIPVLLVIAALGGAAYLGVHPEKGEELWALAEEKLGDRLTLVEKAPTLELSTELEQPVMSYACPKDIVEPAVGVTVSCDFPDPVYTWFRDVDGDLWISCPNMGYDCQSGGAFIAGQQGIVKQMDAGVCALDAARGEIRVPREVLAELPEGDYWLGVRVFPCGEDYYMTVPLCLRDEASFRSPQVGLATRGVNNCILYAQDEGGELPFHLYNLGENRVTRVCTLERPPITDIYNAIPLSEEDYEISADGHTVTLTEAFLKDRTPRTLTYFRFELGDGTYIDTTVGSDWEVYLLPYEGDYDLPYIHGPYTYSASSGEDYVLTYHLGDAAVADFGDAGIVFALPGGIMEEKFALRFDPEAVGEDGTYVIPASIFQEAAARGCDYYLVIQGFYVSATGWITASYSGRLVP